MQELNASIDLGLSSIADSLNEFSGRLLHLNTSVHEVISNLDQPISGPFDELYPTTFCHALPPSSPSGYYWVIAANGSAVREYCDDISILCGGVTGEWRRVAHLDMTNSSHQCPSGLRMHNDSNKRTCVRNSDRAGCSSICHFLQCHIGIFQSVWEGHSLPDWGS